MRTLLLPMCLAVAACSGPTGPVVPSFSTELQPILSEKCVKCHQAGGIGLFRLDDYAQAKAHAGAIADAVEAGRMPPFYATHDGTCGDFRAAEALTDAEKQTILAWARGGAPEGPAKPVTPVPLPHLEGARELATPVFAPVPQGGALAAFDEYRCFAVPHGADHEAFITGYDVAPGDARIVHHVIGFLLDPAKPTRNGKTNGQVAQELDAASPDRAGWPCFGTADDEGLLRIDSAPVDWAPGQGIIEYPTGMGVPLRPDHLLVIQVHYNLADPAARDSTDSTKVRLRTSDSVDRKLVFVQPDGFLQTLFGPSPTPAALPPGAASTKYTWKATPAELGLDGLPYVDLMAVMPHMHSRGRALELRIADACAARVDEWDFHWQRMYYYADGGVPRLTGSSQLEVTCDYDTSRDTSPVLPGWGTRNEMCLVVLMLALPQGI